MKKKNPKRKENLRKTPKGKEKIKQNPSSKRVKLGADQLELEQII